MFKEVLRQSSWYFAGYSASVIISLITFPLWTRHFTVEEYGILTLIAATLTFVTPMARLGLHKSVLRFFAEFRSGARELPESSLYTTFFIGSVTLGGMVGLLFLGVILLLGPEPPYNACSHHPEE